MRYLLLIGAVLMSMGMGCNNIPRDEHPERTVDTCVRWNAEGVTPCPSREPALQSGRQPAPSEAPNE